MSPGVPQRLWPHLRELVEQLRRLSIPMRMRTNLVALDRPDTRGLAAFLATSGVGLLASLPGTDSEQVSQQRGDVFADCVGVLQDLASLGYGAPDGPPLEIAYNPPAGELPAGEQGLERRFAEHFSAMGVPIGRVRAIANVPVGRLRRGTVSRWEAQQLPPGAGRPLQPHDGPLPGVPPLCGGRVGRASLRLRLQPGRRSWCGRWPEHGVRSAARP